RLEGPEDQDETRPLRLLGEAGEPARDPALVLFEDVDPHEEKDQKDERRDQAAWGSSGNHQVLRSTTSFKASTRLIRTRSPGARSGGPSASQYSPWKSTRPLPPVKGSPPRAVSPIIPETPVRAGIRRS